jgi:hypothetical protein
MSWEAGKFRQTIPVRPGDFVPVWETEQEVVAVIQKFTVSVAGERFDSEPVEVSTSIQSGGPMKRNRGHFLVVDGFTVPEPPPRINPVTGRPHD